MLPCCNAWLEFSITDIYEMRWGIVTIVVMKIGWSEIFLRYVSFLLIVRYRIVDVSGSGTIVELEILLALSIINRLCCSLSLSRLHLSNTVGNVFFVVVVVVARVIDWITNEFR